MSDAFAKSGLLGRRVWIKGSEVFALNEGRQRGTANQLTCESLENSLHVRAYALQLGCRSCDSLAACLRCDVSRKAVDTLIGMHFGDLRGKAKQKK